MKVLMLNGSPHEKGSTFTALSEMEKVLIEEGIETEIVQIGTSVIAGCRGCGACGKLGKCVIDDKVNEFAEKARAADGLVFGSPVHYAAASGSITSFLDRLFYSGGRPTFRLKPCACIAVARRAGTTAALEQLNKYPTICEMPLISSKYWNMVHGACPEDVMKDEEGLQTVRILARNMAWFLKCKEAGEKAGIKMPEDEKKIMTNFIKK